MASIYGELINLKSLTISDSQITSLPNTIGTLNSLESLQMMNGILTSIPDEICNITNLNSLIVGGNQLSILPNCLFEIDNLSTLQIWGNLLTSIPSYDIVCNIPSVEVNGNKLCEEYNYNCTETYFLFENQWSPQDQSNCP